MDVAVLYSRIRRDEKLLLRELRDRGHDVTKVDVRKERFGVHGPPAALEGADIVVARHLSTTMSTPSRAAGGPWTPNRSVRTSTFVKIGRASCRERVSSPV